MVEHIQLTNALELKVRTHMEIRILRSKDIIANGNTYCVRIGYAENASITDSVLDSNTNRGIQIDNSLNVSIDTTAISNSPAGIDEINSDYMF